MSMSTSARIHQGKHDVELLDLRAMYRPPARRAINSLWNHTTSNLLNFPLTPCPSHHPLATSSQHSITVSLRPSCALTLPNAQYLPPFLPPIVSRLTPKTTARNPIADVGSWDSVVSDRKKGASRGTRWEGLIFGWR